MDKIRVLFIPSDVFGVGHYRQIWPAKEIQNKHKDFQIDIKPGVAITEDDLDKYDLVHFHRFINGPDKSPEWIKKFQDRGVVVVADIDDHWVPFIGHPKREIAIKQGLPGKILKSLKLADYVTTTTEIFAEHIKKEAGVDAHIIPNAVDTNAKQWTPREVKSDRVRIGWIGGSSHEKDLNRLKGTFNKLFNDNELKDKFQIVMCGYDTRGQNVTINPDTGKRHVTKMKPEDSIWVQFEEIFSDYGRADENQYVRRDTLPITRFGEHYNHCDICLSPLVQNTFNEVKSELKIIEAGVMGKALIASDVYMYNRLLTHGENAMLIDPKKDHKLWFKYIKKLILDEDLRRKLSTNLHELVTPKYTLEYVTKERCQWYKQILQS